MTLTSVGNDTMTGAGTNDIFLFKTGYGHDTVADLSQHLTGAGHDTVSVSTTEFANFKTLVADTTTVNGNAVITGNQGDTITLLGVTKDMVAANKSDFSFHA